MKLAVITPDAAAQCLLCSWRYKAPTKRRKGQEELTLQERLRLLEENTMAHLRHGHDRLLLTKEELPAVEEGKLGVTYYVGRRPERIRW